MIYRSYFVLAVAFVLMFVVPSFVFAQNATLFFSPDSIHLKEGETVWIDVMVDTGGENVNAIAAYFSYPPDKLEATGVNTDDSIMTLVAQQEMGQGLIKITGGTPTPGFSGIHTVGSVGFLGKSSSGVATLKFNTHAAVVTDKHNQNILHNPSEAQFFLGAQTGNILFGGITIGMLQVLIGILITLAALSGGILFLIHYKSQKKLGGRRNKNV